MAPISYPSFQQMTVVMFFIEIFKKLFLPNKGTKTSFIFHYATKQIIMKFKIDQKKIFLSLLMVRGNRHLSPLMSEKKRSFMKSTRDITANREMNTEI